MASQITCLQEKEIVLSRCPSFPYSVSMPRVPLMNLSTMVLYVILALSLAFDGCDTEAVNNPGVDVQMPVVSFVTPISLDTLGVDTVAVVLTASDNDDVSRIELFLNNAATPFAELTEAPWETFLDAALLPEGSHQLKAVAYDACGNRGTAQVTLRNGPVLKEDVLRVSLVEIVTSANCSHCGPQNEAYHLGTWGDLYEQRVATIKYHVWFPRPTDNLWKHSMEWCLPRVEYLFAPVTANQYGAPQGWVGGQRIGVKAVEWIAAADADMEKSAGAKIECESTRTGNTITLTITVTGIETSAYSDLRLHTVVTESDIEYNDGNSENFHHDVMRRMYPDAFGEAVTIGNKQSALYTRMIAINPEWNPENLRAVVFLQSKVSKEILQAAILSL